MTLILTLKPRQSKCPALSSPSTVIQPSSFANFSLSLFFYSSSSPPTCPPWILRLHRLIFLPIHPIYSPSQTPYATPSCLALCKSSHPLAVLSALILTTPPPRRELFDALNFPHSAFAHRQIFLGVFASRLLDGFIARAWQLRLGHPRPPPIFTAATYYVVVVPDLQASSSAQTRRPVPLSPLHRLLLLSLFKLLTMLQALISASSALLSCKFSSIPASPALPLQPC